LYVLALCGGACRRLGSCARCTLHRRGANEDLRTNESPRAIFLSWWSTLWPTACPGRQCPSVMMSRSSSANLYCPCARASSRAPSRREDLHHHAEWQERRGELLAH